MFSKSNILREMIENASLQGDSIEANITQISDQISQMETQIIGVRDGLCGAIKLLISEYITDTKIPELEASLGKSPLSLVTGSTFGTINYTSGNVSDWTVVDSTGGIVYQYLGINWDGDTSISKYIYDYSFGNDYLTKPLTEGATYGLMTYQNNLTSAQSILQNNADKIAESIEVFEDYAV